jgi:ABC-type Fe3+-hydroxamate transport system substrate-binding protein
MSKLFALLAVLATIVLAGCGTTSNTATKTNSATAPTAVKTATAINAPFAFEVAGSTVTVSIDAAQGAPSNREEPVQVVCANLAANGFSDRDQAEGTWRLGALSTTVTLPKSADGLDLCALSFTARTGKQTIAFFSATAKAKYLADQKASK